MRKTVISLAVVTMLAAFALPAMAVPLNVVEVDSPNINCLFVSPCTQLVSFETEDSIPITLGGINRVTTRTYEGQPGTRASTFTAYVYQLSLAEAINVRPETCITSFTIEFGHVINAFDYNDDGQTGDEVFVIRSGSTGSIGLASAEKVADEIKFTFAEPICGGSTSAQGGMSYKFGLVSTQEPHHTMASVRGAPVFRDYEVEVRTPMIETFSLVTLQHFDMDGNRMLSDGEFFNAIDMWLSQETIPGTNAQIDDLTFFRIIDWWVGGSPIIFDFDQRGLSMLNSTMSFTNGRFIVTFGAQNVERVQLDLYSTSGERVLTQHGAARHLSFSAHNTAGQPLANGVYFYQITGWDAAGNIVTTEVKKLAIVR